MLFQQTLFLLSCLLANAANAEESTTFLSGSVYYEGELNVMVSDVTVTLTSADFEGVAFITKTDDDGAYQFNLADLQDQVGEIQNWVVSLEYPFSSQEQSLVVSPIRSYHNSDDKVPKVHCLAEFPQLPDPEADYVKCEMCDEPTLRGTYNDILVGGGGEKLAHHPASASSGYVIFGLSPEYYVEGLDFGVEHGVVLESSSLAVSLNLPLVYVLEYVKATQSLTTDEELERLVDEWILKGGETVPVSSTY